MMLQMLSQTRFCNYCRLSKQPGRADQLNMCFSVSCFAQEKNNNPAIRLFLLAARWRCFVSRHILGLPRLAFSRCKQDSILNSKALYAMIDKLEYFYFYNEVEPASQPANGGMGIAHRKWGFITQRVLTDFVCR